MRSPRRLQWLWVALLLLAQEAGVVHLTLHAARSLADVQGTSHSLPSDCPECAQFSANGAALAPTVPLLSVAAVRREVVPAPTAAVARETFRLYRSRAPPVSI